MPRRKTSDEALNLAYDAIDKKFAHESGATRRQLVGGAAVTLGAAAAATVPGVALAQQSARKGGNDPQTVLNVAASAEVLATIVNTVGAEKVALDRVTRRNVRAAAREELIHFEAIKSLGGVEASKSIWVPNSVFASAENLLNTLEVGDQIFINAYLIGTTVFADNDNSTAARYAAEIMGVEAVHRALARQSLGKLGNDRAFMKYDQVETAPGAPNAGQAGFTDITVAVSQLQAAGFGFGEQGATPGRFYDYDNVSSRTPNPSGVNTLTVA